MAQIRRRFNPNFWEYDTVRVHHWAAVPYIIAAVGTIGQMAGQNQQAQSQAQQYKESAKAIDVQTNLEVNAAEKQRQFALAKNQARTEAGGIASGSGSPLEFELENAFNSGMNEASIRYSGDIKKRQAKFGVQSANAAGTASTFQGIGQLGSIGGQWYKASGGKLWG